METYNMQLDKAKIETICDRAQLRLEKRLPIGQYELFIAAGESKPPHFRYQRFGIEPTEFPLGCYVTMAWLMKGEEKLVIAWPAFFDRNHNPELGETDKKQARINRAVTDAEGFLQARMRARRMKQTGTVH